MTQEQWKDIEGYEERYQISSHGRVWMKEHDRCKKPGGNGKGYVIFTLADGGRCNQTGFTAHRLVMQHFGPEPPTEDHTHINHIDGDPTNNRLSNLQWVTPAENRLHESLRNVVEQQGKATAEERVDEWL